MKLTKLNDLDFITSFLQVNTVNGYKYIDKAGEIANLYSSVGKKPEIISIGITGIEILNPTQNIDQIRITSSSVWAQFVSPKSLQFASDNFNNQVKTILGIIDVKEISRIGWRNQFIYEFKDGEVEKFETINAPLLGGRYINQSIQLKITESISSVFSFQPIKTKDSKTINALLLDYDLYIESLLSLDKIVKLLAQMAKHLTLEEGFIGYVNKIINN